jgi:hypothetical protein
MAAGDAYSGRSYIGAAPATTLNGGITNNATTLTLTSGTGYPTANFGLVLDPGQATEEKVWVGSRSGAACSSVVRGADGTSGQAHSSGAVVIHKMFAQDATEANAVASAQTTKGDLLAKGGTATVAPARLAVGGDLKYLRGRAASTLGLQYDYAPVVFASTAARDTELASPVAGMVCYVASGDVNEGLYTYNGTSWRKGPGWNAPWGILGYAEATSDQTSVSTLADVTSLTLTVTLVSNRRYRLSSGALFTQATSASSQTFGLYTGSSGAGTLLAYGPANTGLNQAAIAGLTAAYAATVVTGSGSTSYHARASAVAGTLTVSNTTSKGWIMIEDIGPSSTPA